jgi:HD-GYP domain-containing protein (c-di-GMP phosphodiesterase class II)
MATEDASTMSPTEDGPQSPNPHYVDHVVNTAATRGIEASENIVASNGTKLVAKGSRIDAHTRDRLLQHKLSKPLEECVRVIDAVAGDRLRETATQLIGQHALLRSLCSGGRGRPVPDSLAGLKLSTPLQSMLSVYAESQPDRLAHTVGVAMVALALARRIWPGEIDLQRPLALAGLLHDAGELYIDPAYLRRDTKLGPEQWRHIASHPITAHRILREMEGAGAAVAAPVLLHHERLDGFGYPRGVSGEGFALGGQVLAVAEWLMALLDSGYAPLTRADLAPRLMPGEFDDALLAIVSEAARAALNDAPEPVPPLSVNDALPRIERIAETLARHRGLLPWIDEQIRSAGPALRALLEAGRHRVMRVQASFSSMGFDAKHPAMLLAEWVALSDPAVDREVATQLRELQWRMREMQRETLLRAWMLPPEDAAVVDELMARLRGAATG